MSETIVHLPAVEKHKEHLREGFEFWPTLIKGTPPAMGDARWPAELILSTWHQGSNGKPPQNGLEYRTGDSGGGFDKLRFKFLAEGSALPPETEVSLSIVGKVIAPCSLKSPEGKQFREILRPGTF